MKYSILYRDYTYHGGRTIIRHEKHISEHYTLGAAIQKLEEIVGANVDQNYVRMCLNISNEAVMEGIRYRVKIKYNRRLKGNMRKYVIQRLGA